MKIGGNNVDLIEVEEVLRSHEGVEDVKLSVAEDNLWGHRIEADMKPAPGKEINDKEIRHFCTNKLALYKLPKKISIV